MENYEEKIRFQYNEVKKEYNKIINHREYYLDKKEKYKNLEHRSECPCCDQKINWDHYKSKIPELEEKYKKYDKKLDDIIPKKVELEKKLREIYDKKQKEEKKNVDNYLKGSRNKLNKAIRDYDNGIENYLPNIPDEEKEIWNKAMEIQLDKKGIEDNDELYFDI